MKITISQPWRGRQRLFAPGTYSIPGEISRLEARCCEADACGLVEAVEVQKQPDPFRPAPPKPFAPENKLRAPAPETKSEVETVRRRRKRAEPDA
jgi:hypothetical protein